MQFGLLLILTFFASFAEIFSIGAVLPFLGILIAPDRIFDNNFAQPIINLVGITESSQLLGLFTVVFALAAVVAGGMRLLLLWASTRLSYATGADLSISIYRRTLYQPYTVHCNRNSSEIIDGILNKTSGVISVISMTLTLISSGIMLVTILISLVILNPIVALTSICGLGLVYVVIIQLTKKRLLSNSEKIALESTKALKSLQEGLGGIRDVLIDGSQAEYCQAFQKADLPIRRAQGNNAFIGNSPRYGMEALGMVLIAALAYSLAIQPNGVVSAIPLLGALAIGAQRLLPVLQQVYSAYVAIQGGQASLREALDLLDQPLPPHADQTAVKPLRFEHQIELKQLYFRYGPETPVVLRQLNLTIPKGGRIGFIGVTGSGKSTLLDIVMGLLEPTGGVFEVDGKPVTTENQHAWKCHIAHVPQAIFLADSSVEENIAFGVHADHIDSGRVRWAAQQAHIADTITSWPQQYKTVVGENGVRLSGGQRQRLGIARAFYKKANVIILDEATSALDSDTEQDIMLSIGRLQPDLTVLMIAHRLTTLKNCTKIVELRDGKINRVGSYQEIVEQSLDRTMMASNN